MLTLIGQVIVSGVVGIVIWTAVIAVQLVIFKVRRDRKPPSPLLSREEQNDLFWSEVLASVLCYTDALKRWFKRRMF